MKQQKKRKNKYYVPMVHDSKRPGRNLRKVTKPYRREDPKRMVEHTPFYVVKHGSRKLIINRHSGEVVVKARKDDRVMVNSKYAKAGY